MFNHRIQFLGLLLVLSPISTAHSQGWQWVTPLPTGDLCYSVSFVDSLEGWVVGAGSGMVIHTKDGGRNWTYEDTGVRTYYNDVYFADKDHGWAGGGRDIFVISRTTDGGQTWLKTEISADSLGRPVFPVSLLQFFGRDTGFAASGYEVFKTTDGGNSWIGLPIKRALKQMGLMSFLNGRMGFVLCDSLYKTIDGGKTWATISGQLDNTLGDMYFRDSLHGWIASSASGLSRTTDGGITWEAQTGFLSLSSLSFPDPRYGWAFGKDGIYTTSDSGKTWQQQSAIQFLVRGRMTSILNGFAVGGSGGIFRTTNGGLTWDTLGSRVTSVSLSGTFMRNSQEVWTVGGDLNHGEVLYSSNGGTTWIKRVASSQSWLRSITFGDSSTGWASGDGGAILKSMNGGSDWQVWPSPTTARLWKVLFKDASHGWCAGAGVILHTTDEGNNWGTYQVPSGDDIQSIHFQDAQRGWAVGGSVNNQRGVILHTTDGGVSWSIQYSELVNPFYSVAFQDSLAGWATGDIVVRTTNGGVTWQQYPWTYSNTPTCIYFANPRDGWMATFSGEFVHTTDGGTTWQNQRSPASVSIWAMTVSEVGVGFAVGMSGSILKTTTGGVSWVIPHARSESPDLFTLHQCYPNPFNSSTTIRYDLTFRSHVTLKVYNVLGEEIARLVNASQEPGTHEIKFNGTIVPSGVYFYRLMFGASVRTMKMLLLK